jgi:integrase
MNPQDPVQPMPLREQHHPWRWPILLMDYDRSPALSEGERAAVQQHLSQTSRVIDQPTRTLLHRLVQPIFDVFTYVRPADGRTAATIAHILLAEMHQRNTSFWGWTQAEWKDVIGPDHLTFRQRWSGIGTQHLARWHLPVLAYVLEVLPDTSALIALVDIVPVARKIFGQEAVEAASQRLFTLLRSWGYQRQDASGISACVCYLLLKNHSPALEELSLALLEEVSRTCSLFSVQHHLFQVSRALAGLHIIEQALPSKSGSAIPMLSQADGSLDEEWASWCERWRRTTVLQDRDNLYYILLKVGRWLKATHPAVTSPVQWTYELAAEFVAAVMDMRVGEWVYAATRARIIPAHRLGQPLSTNARARHLKAMRMFLQNCQEWEWMPTRLNPGRAIRIPASVRNQLGANPRVIEKPLWAKILWAALNLEAADLPLGGKNQRNKLPAYPLEMVRAIAMVWCFAALRSDEIVRLRVGCIRWQYEDVMIPETGEILPRDATCFLSVPVNKTLAAYTKPVHPLVGKRIKEWELVRPQVQPASVDLKTSERVQFLFSYRGQRISQPYINGVLVPLLCKKAGIPEHDNRGPITSHRARATIASMLYNAHNPLDIFQIQQYLGHKYLSSTQHYTQVDPTKLAYDVAHANYLEQNLATIEVLLDQDVVMSGAAARGERWKYYDLGHGWCTNPFWASCAHRMACARCPYYCPKESLADQLMEGKANLAHMLEFVKLTEEEKLLVTEGMELHQELLDKLTDVPTPAGPTPRELKRIPLELVQPTTRTQSDER